MINIKTYLYMDELDFLDIIETPLIDGGDFLQLLLRFGFNFLVTGIIIHLFYYQRASGEIITSPSH